MPRTVYGPPLIICFVPREIAVRVMPQIDEASPRAWGVRGPRRPVASGVADARRARGQPARRAERVFELVGKRARL
jgi:hypothetical protein